MSPSSVHLGAAPRGADALARSLARRAMEQMRRGLLDSAVSLKADGTEVTAVDQAINALVIEQVGRRFPAHRVLGEEGIAGPADAEWVWVCDPIDGTLTYAMGLGLSAFSLALCHDGQPALAVVGDPWAGGLFYAERGAGALRVHQPCAVSSRDRLAGARVAVCGAHEGPLLERLRALGARPIAPHATVTSGAAVATGGLDALVCAYDPGAWDVAAVALLVKESGGWVGRVDGTPVRYDEPIRGPWMATTPSLWGPLADLCAEVGVVASSSVTPPLR